MKHYDLVIITNYEIDESILENLEYLIIYDDIILEDYFKIENGSFSVTYDNLIFSKLDTVKNLDIMKDGGFVVTNYNLETSIDNIYAIGEITKLDDNINNQLQRILENITF